MQRRVVRIETPVDEADEGLGRQLEVGGVPVGLPVKVRLPPPEICPVTVKWLPSMLPWPKLEDPPAIWMSLAMEIDAPLP